MTETVRKQASLTPKLGGLGLRRTVDHANFSFHASWHEKGRPLRRTGIALQGSLKCTSHKQMYRSLLTRQRHAAMVREAEQAGNRRDAQRLRRCAQPHASGFITAMPSQHDGFDTVLRPKTFRTAVRYRLGIPILPKEMSCPLCMQTINVYGDHATCCSKSGDLIVRHNAMRNLVNEIAEDGLLSPVLEKKGILGDANGRPGDVTIPLWEEGRGLALDILQGQRDPYLRHLCGTFGAINSEGEAYLRQLMRFASKHLDLEHTFLLRTHVVSPLVCLATPDRQRNRAAHEGAEVSVQAGRGRR